MTVAGHGAVWQEYSNQLWADLPFGRLISRRIVDEITDHALETIDALSREGMSHNEAVARAIERLGPPTAVALSFARSRGLGMPTTTTRLAGLAGMLAPFLMVFGLLMESYDGMGDPGHWIGGGALFASALGLLFLSFGLWRRHAGALGIWGRAALFTIIAAPVLALPFGWGAGLAIISYFGIAVLMLGVGVWRTDLFPHAPLAIAAIGLLWPVVIGGVGAIAGFDGARYMSFGVGPLAIGLVWMGFILWTERAEESNPPDSPVAFA